MASSEVFEWCLDFLVCNSESVIQKLMSSKRNVVIEKSGSCVESRLKKSILLQTLESHVSKANITESTLEALEGMEELHLCDGSTLTPSITPAYCAVALECTLKYLQSDPSVHNNPLYLNALQRIWRDRFTYLEAAGSLLYSSDLHKWRIQLEASLLDNNLGIKLAALNTRRNAIRKVKHYLGKAWSDLGPSFIQLLTQPSNKVTTDTGGPSVPIPTNPGTTDTGGPSLPIPIPIPTNPGTTGTGGPSLPVPTNQGTTDTGGPSLPVPTNPGTTGTGGPSLPVPTNQGTTYTGRPSLPVPTNQGTTDTGGPSLPVPTNQGTTDTGGPSIPIPTNQGATPPPNQHKSLAPPSIELQNQTTTPVVVENMNPPNTCAELHSLPQRPQIQEQTFVNDPPQSGFHLPNPKRKIVSPLNKYQPVNITKRRKPKKWSALEEDTLKSAVKEIGEGNWKAILISNLDIFSERTPTDLKDKWRNMARCGGI